MSVPKTYGNQICVVVLCIQTYTLARTRTRIHAYTHTCTHASPPTSDGMGGSMGGWSNLFLFLRKNNTQGSCSLRKRNPHTNGVEHLPPQRTVFPAQMRHALQAILPLRVDVGLIANAAAIEAQRQGVVPVKPYLFNVPTRLNFLGVDLVVARRCRRCHHSQAGQRVGNERPAATILKL